MKTHKRKRVRGHDSGAATRREEEGARMVNDQKRLNVGGLKNSGAFNDQREEEGGKGTSWRGSRPQRQANNRSVALWSMMKQTRWSKGGDLCNLP